MRWTAIIAGVAILTLARLAYLAFWCPYSLVEDEAFYWEWSRRLELSYYTKGPGIAWTIAATTRLFGDTEFGVRAAAPVCSGLTALALALLARRALASQRAAFYAAACFLLVPLFQVLGLLMTIDGPYALCWTLAALLAWIGIKERRGWALALVGLMLGVGFLYKYTILLALPGLALAWWFTRATPAPASHPANTTTRRDHSALGLRLGAFGAPLLFLVAIAPVIIWNAREGWPTIAHLLGHLGVAGGDTAVTQGSGGWTYNPMWTIGFLGTQVGMVGPVLALMLIGLARARREHPPHHPARAGAMFLWWFGAPLLAFYILVSFIAEPEGNWALAAYLSWFPLAGLALARGMPEWRAKLLAWRTLPTPRPRRGFFVRRPETLTQVLWYTTCVVGLATLAGLPLLVPLARLGDAAKRYPRVARVVPDWAYIPVGRFTGAREIGAHVDRLMKEVYSAHGRDTFIVAMHYGRAAQLAFYMPTRPVVYCASSLVGGRTTQYDYWDDTDLRRQPHLLGTNAIVIGSADMSVWTPYFDRVELVGKLDGEGKRNRPAYRAYGFKGFTTAAPGDSPTNPSRAREEGR
jgi:undecaprenyl-diphosphatase